MTPSEPDLEKLLRQAPHPNPPPGLRQAILRTAPADRVPASESPTAGLLQRWLGSWRFATAALCLALATLVVAAVQQAELQQLRRQVEELRQQLEARRAAPPQEVVSATPRPGGSVVAAAPQRTDREDLERLRAELLKLQADQASRAKLAAENEQLRGELATLARQALPAEFAAMRDARERAQRISCVNNMKQLGLAVRIYANDNKDVFPKEILAMTNELNTPKILVCPADTNRQPAASWSVFTPANLGYEYLASDGTETEPSRVLFRCTVHRGSVGLCDGSVQQLSETMQAQRLVLRDGRLYLDSSPQPAAPGGRQP